MSLLIFYVAGIIFVFLVGSFVFLICLCRGIKIRPWFLYVLVSASIYMIVAQYLKYRSLHFYVDFEHWAELLYNISNTGKPLCISADFVIQGIKNYFAAHFVPFIYIFAVPFKVWQYCPTLMVLNFLLMASSTIPLYKLSEHCGNNERFGLFTAALLLWYPTFQYIVLYEFEMLRFSIPTILWMLYFWEKKNIVLYFVFVFLAVLVREEVGLTIMIFGLYLILIEKKFRFGFITSIIGFGAFFVITQMVMPLFSTSASYRHVAAEAFSDFGSSPFEAFVGVVRHPMMSLAVIFQWEKLANIFMLFLPLLFIPFLASGVLIAAIANLGMGMISNSNVHISYMLYYVSPSIPFIFYAFIKGWPKLMILLEAFTKKWTRNLKGDLNLAAMSMALAGVLAANVFFGPSPVSMQFWFKDLRPAPFRTQNFHYSVYRITTHHRKVGEFCNLIPGSSVVSAQQFLFTCLFKKRGTMIFPRLESKDGSIKADYVFFDKTNNNLGEESLAYTTQAEFDLVEKDKKTWGLVKSDDGYFLYKRNKDKNP